MTLLQALSSMLMPAVGDVTRILGHLDYRVVHVQYPLEEYEYQIDNLAVDLRDGVRLTRVMELLLYPSASSLLARAKQGDVTTTVAMPTGEVLSLLDGEQDWPLSQHLKIPCMGRATKLFNVQVALSALSGVKGVGLLAQNVMAEDIVDGFREKTVALLWGLVEKWGLGVLIDWVDVRAEIQRLRKKSWQGTGDDEEDEVGSTDDDTTGYDVQQYRHLLQNWASAVATFEGLRVDNFTTSFADGRIFEVIVDHYERFMIGKKRQSVTESQPLASRLTALGCSVGFATLFAPTRTGRRTSHIFDREFVMAALAFLCSRLLAASKQWRAASTIQRGWRRHTALRDMRRRLVVRRLAHECTTVVKTRERLLWAKRIIWSAWMIYCSRTGKNGGPAIQGPMSEVVDGNSGGIWLSL